MTQAEIMDQVILNEEAHQAIYQWWGPWSMDNEKG